MKKEFRDRGTLFFDKDNLQYCHPEERGIFTIQFYNIGVFKKDYLS
jgi:hypothetical protein